MRKLAWIFALLWFAIPALCDDADAGLPEAEAQLVSLVNQEREKQGLAALKVDDRLTAAARQHSQLLAEHHLLSHQFEGEPPLPKRLAARFVRFDSDGENVAFDTSIEQAHDGLMHSPPHRANILNPKFTAIGIGIVKRGNYFWVTEDFAHRLESLSEDQAADAVAQAFQRERKEARAPGLSRIKVDSLHRLACDMAHQDRLETQRVLSVTGASTAVVYTQGEPGQLPSSAQRLRDDRELRRFAVGVCFADSPQYPAGTYWIVLVAY